MTFKDYKQEIERIAYMHRYDAGAMFGTLTVMEATNAYNDLLRNVLDDDTLSDEEKRNLSTEIKVKIGQIPKVEEEKETEEKLEQEKYNQAFAEAKRRFKNLSFFERIKLNIKGKGPDQLDHNFLDIEDVRGLYRK